MILKCIDGPMGGATYTLSRQQGEPSTNRKPDGLWFDRQEECGQWVEDQYGFDRLAEGGDHVTMVYRYGGSIPLIIPGTQSSSEVQSLAMPHDDDRRDGHSAIRVADGKLERFDPHPCAESQRDDEAWMHAACLTIAETGQKWGGIVHPSPAMEAVYRLRLRNDLLQEAAREARAALYGCREVLGSVANIQHAIDLLNRATCGLNYVQSRELTPDEHTEARIKNATEGAVDAYDE